MPYNIQDIPLLQSHIGTQRSIRAHQFFGTGQGPKVYLQAGLHAAEVPGMVIARHLLAMLAQAEAEGRVLGEITVVPAANPVGLGAVVLGAHVGRHALASGQNFNRNFPDLAALVAADLTLGTDPDANVGAIRASMARALDGLKVRNELEDMRRQLMRLAVTSDYVFDLHAEEDALFAAVLAPFTLPFAGDLLAGLSPDLVFWADYPPLFDTALSRPWAELARRFPEAAIPQGCKSVTLELRGSGHVNDAQARTDAAALFDTFIRLGVVDGTQASDPVHPEPIRFEGVEFIRAAEPGIVVYRRELGDTISAGEVLAEIYCPDAADPLAKPLPVIAEQGGVFFACCHAVLVQRDDVVAKVAGPQPLVNPRHY